MASKPYAVIARDVFRRGDTVSYEHMVLILEGIREDMDEVEESLKRAFGVTGGQDSSS
jgi:hypothetical protein